MNQLYESLNDTLVSFVGQYVGKYISLDLSIWLYRILTPLVVTFLLPCIFVLLIYFSSLTLYIFRWHKQVILQSFDSGEFSFWNVARKFIAAMWDGHAWIYHGYEVIGMDNLPVDGPALIVYYHGAIPIDMYYFVARVYLERDRLIYTVADNFLFKLPGWQIIADAFKVTPGTIQSCSQILKEGNYLAISPGGVFEAQFGDSNYELMWGKRVGFARVALESNAPIIPMFTENLREGFRAVNFARSFCLRLYSAFRFPIRPIWGGFPVKFRTYLGKPIAYDSTMSPEELQTKCAAAIRDLIDQHQRIPGSIFHAMLDRFRSKGKKD